MFGYDPKKNINESIKIKYAKIVKGKFELSRRSGSYESVSSGVEQNMLKIEFESSNNLINDFYISNTNFDGDFQHTTELKQRSFFFPLKDLPIDQPIDQLRVYGVKLDLEQSSKKLRPVGEVIAKSKLIHECLLKTQDTPTNPNTNFFMKKIKKIDSFNYSSNNETTRSLYS